MLDACADGVATGLDRGASWGADWIGIWQRGHDRQRHGVSRCQMVSCGPGFSGARQCQARARRRLFVQWWSSRVPCAASRFMLGVLVHPGPAPPLWNSTSLYPMSSTSMSSTWGRVGGATAAVAAAAALISSVVVAPASRAQRSMLLPVPLRLARRCRKT
jgi:hypothetical protein